MNRGEIAMLFTDMSRIWKTFNAVDESLKTWSEVLSEVSYEAARRALDSYAKTSSEFSPNPYQLLSHIPRKDKQRDVFESDPAYPRMYLEQEIAKGKVVCGEKHPAGFSFRLKDPFHTYGKTGDKVVLYGLEVELWRD